jgi:glycosyltransferase involved in cell wall biosynthesis
VSAPVPAVSVVMPTRNRAELLKRSIASIRAQTFSDFELIVINDGSTDHTAEVLAAIGDPRLRVIHNALGGGAAAARNAGIAAARGEFLAFQDDDDFWLVQKLELQVAALRQAPPQTQWCLCGYIRMEHHQVRYFGGQFYYDQLDYDGGIGYGGPDYSLIATPCWLVRRGAFQQAGVFDPRIRSWDDWELGLRLFGLGKPVFVDAPLFVQDHVQGAGMMLNEPARANDLQIIMDKHGARWAGRRRVLARHYYTIGRIHSLHQAERGAGRGWLFKSLGQQPFRLMTWLALGLSLFDKDLVKNVTRRARNLRRKLGR